MGGGKGGGGGSSTSRVYQTSLPEYARPYYERMMKRGEGVSNLPYESYGDPRIQGFVPDTLRAQQGVRGMVDYGTPATDAALGYSDYATQRAFSAGNYRPNAVSGAGIWDQAAADYYMSPYINNVINEQKSQAVLDFDRAKSARNTAAVKAEAFGGSRHGVQDYLASERLAGDLQRIEREGLQSGFENAQRQYLADEENRQRALQLGLSGDALAMQGAGQLAGIDAGRQQQLFDQYRNLGAVGQDVQNLGQRQLDLGYNDFINQRDFERQNVAFLSGLLHGVPVSPQGEIITTQQTNPYSALLGLGLGGLGLYQAFNQS